MWVSQNGPAVAAVKAKLQTRRAEQFLCLYGHQIPASLPDAPKQCTYCPVTRFELFKSDSRLLFREGDTIATRIGRISCYPAALAPLTGPRSVTRFRLLSAEQSGNALSFGLCASSFPTSTTNGIGPTKGTWGLFEPRDSYVSSRASIYADGVKLDTWRSLVAGDSITIDCDTNTVRC